MPKTPEQKAAWATYMREYYRRPGVAEKWRERVRKYREENIEKVREKDRARGPGGLRSTPEKVRARRKAYYHHVEKGERQPCEVCGGDAHLHHPDYDQPLEVRWLCSKHHGEEHREVA